MLFYAVSFVPSIRANLGLIFYLWVGIFNMMMVATFWSFANEVYTKEEGERLFALVAVGQSVGAVAGGGVGIAMEDYLRTLGELGVYLMLLIAGGLLATSAILTQLVFRRERARMADRTPKGAAVAAKDAQTTDEQKSTDGAFQLVFRHKYLLLIAAFSLVFTLVNSNGEYMFGKLVSENCRRSDLGWNA